MVQWNICSRFIGGQHWWAEFIFIGLSNSNALLLEFYSHIRWQYHYFCWAMLVPLVSTLGWWDFEINSQGRVPTGSMITNPGFRLPHLCLQFCCCVLVLQASVLSGDYRFPVSNMDKNWKEINDFLTLKVAGEKQVLFYQYCLGLIILCFLDQLLSSVVDNAFFKFKARCHCIFFRKKSL